MKLFESDKTFAFLDINPLSYVYTGKSDALKRTPANAILTDAATRYAALPASEDHLDVQSSILDTEHRILCERTTINKT